MKTLNNTQEITELVESNNYYFQGQEFENFSDFYKNACNHFNDIEFEYREYYYNQFGVELGECRFNKVKTEKYYVEDLKNVIEVQFYEAYIDSGVNEEDYFHGYILVENTSL